MDYKIIQIIPNSKNLVATYKQDERISCSPILLFALIEYENGEREVITLDIDNSTGYFDDINTLSNFIGLEFL